MQSQFIRTISAELSDCAHSSIGEQVTLTILLPVQWAPAYALMIGDLVRSASGTWQFMGPQLAIDYDSMGRVFRMVFKKVLEVGDGCKNSKNSNS